MAKIRVGLHAPLCGRWELDGGFPEALRGFAPRLHIGHAEACFEVSLCAKL